MKMFFVHIIFSQFTQIYGFSPLKMASLPLKTALLSQKV